jgi:type I restriction enzyme M protein
MTVEELRTKIKSASLKMRADDNTKNALRYLEHLTWLLFLKVFEAVEDERELLATVDGKSYDRIIGGEYRWSAWTSNPALTGDDLAAWVSGSLLPHLRGLAGSREAEKIGQLFGGVNTVMKSGYSLAEVIEIVDEIDFHGLDDYHAMSVIYESLLQEQTGDAGWSGEFYTPRPVVEFMVELIDPRIGETVYDPCHGSAGFLVAAADKMRSQAETTEQEEKLTTGTVFGQESGDLAYLVGTMNLLLHGISEPQTIRRNTLEQDVRNIGPSEQHDIILTNPPFGGTEHPSVQQNFPSRSAATEVLFLQHVMAKLKPTGRAAIVLPDALLSREDSAYVWVRRRLVSEFKLHAIVRLPSGAFFNAPGTRANLVFFSGSETEASESIRYYQVHPPAGKPAKDTRKYRRVEVGDFVYNPMRINVGSLALCREPEEEGWASPDYVVFRLRDDAPFGREYLLRFLKSPAGRAEIDRHTEGSVRARLYYENLCDVEVPVPADPERWEALLRSIEALRRYLRDGVGGDALTALETALFAGGEVVLAT